MTDEYILMHKDVPCGLVAIDREIGTLVKFRPIDPAYAPFLGNADLKYMKIWWKHRAVPGARKDMEMVIRQAGCASSEGYLAKNLALSITDTYWICPADIRLSWEDVNLHKAYGKEKGVLTYHNATSYDPNASLGGQMSKYWDFSSGSPELVKKAYENYGQQCVNEVFATDLHVRQAAGVPFVAYRSKSSENNAVLTCCNAFTSDKVEFVSAYEVLRSRKLRNDRSDYDQYIDICEENGLDREEMQKYMDYLILSDFAITNIDEHLQNFGVLRDADTMKLIGPAPIFDSGNSMFFNHNRRTPLSRVEILEQKISSLHASEEKMLKHISDRSVLDAERLPSAAEVKDFYLSHGMPEERAGFIAGSYKNKLTLLHDYQKGISVSLYNEKAKDD